MNLQLLEAIEEMTEVTFISKLKMFLSKVLFMKVRENAENEVSSIREAMNDKSFSIFEEPLEFNDCMGSWENAR